MVSRGVIEDLLQVPKRKSPAVPNTAGRALPAMRSLALELITYLTGTLPTTCTHCLPAQKINKNNNGSGWRRWICGRPSALGHLFSLLANPDVSESAIGLIEDCGKHSADLATTCSLIERVFEVIEVKRSESELSGQLLRILRQFKWVALAIEKIDYAPKLFQLLEQKDYLIEVEALELLLSCCTEGMEKFWR